MSETMNHHLRILGVFAIVAGLAACYEAGDHSPTSPFFENALTLSVEPSTIPADGFSTARITAQISPAADSANRILEFTTADGSFVDAGTNPKAAEKTVDATGRASIDLRSSQTPGGTEVRVRVKERPEIARIATVTFTPADPAATLRISTERSSLPADDASTTAVFADLSAAVPQSGRSVTFTTTRGRFLGSGTMSETVVVNSDGRARVDLVAPQVPSTARLTATAFNVTREMSFELTPALPDTIAVEPDKLQIEAGVGNDSSTALQIRLRRAVGRVSLGTIPDLTAVDATTGAPLQLLFRNLQPSTAEGLVTAVLTAGPTAFRGVARIEARVSGSPAVGAANVEIIDP